VLEKVGIDINAAENGVFLPANDNAPNPTGAAVHSHVHGDEYYAKVNDLIIRSFSGGRSAVIETLESVRRSLLDGGLD
jgi:hypothetical protein